VDRPAAALAGRPAFDGQPGGDQIALLTVSRTIEFVNHRVLSFFSLPCPLSTFPP
jgi:hypothetical protein